MEIIIKGNGRKIIKKEKENMYGVMEIIILEIGKTIKEMDLVSMWLRMEINSRGNGKMI